MKYIVSVAIFFWASLSFAAEPSIEVYFSPRGGCTAAVVREVGQAKQSVLVQAYVMTSSPIADALVAARGRGVDVAVVCDPGQETSRSSKIASLEASGCEVMIDDRHTLMHSKVIVVDKAIVLTGSFNHSAVAEAGNVENMLVIRSLDVAAKYTANWEQHRGHARKPKVVETKGAKP